MNSNTQDSPSEIVPLQGLDPGAFVIRAIRNDTTLQPSTKHQYIKAVSNYLDTGASLTDPAALADYALSVGSSTRSFLAAAVTGMAQELELLAKGSATPENIDAIQAAVFRAQALQSSIKTSQPRGERAHAWLTPAQRPNSCWTPVGVGPVESRNWSYSPCATGWQSA